MPPEDVHKPLNPVFPLLFLAALNIGGDFVPVPNRLVQLVLSLVLTIVSVGGYVLYALAIARRQFSIPKTLLWLGFCALVYLGIELVVGPFLRHGFIAAHNGHYPPSTLLRIVRAFAKPSQDLALVSGMIFCGTILSRLIRHPNMVGPIGAIIALIDIWGVLFGGIVSQLLTNKATAPIAERAMIAGPSMGRAGRTGPTHLTISVPSIGIGDFLFIALLLSVLVNLNMNWKTSSRLMWLLVTFALLSFSLLPIPALPGLVFIGMAAVIPNWKFFTFTREEKFALLYAGVFVIILTVGLYFGFTSVLAHSPKTPMPQMRRG